MFAPDYGEVMRVVFPVSRLVVDAERFLHDDREIMASKGMGVIYTKTSDGKQLRETPSADHRSKLIEAYYMSHHRLLTDAVEKCLRSNGRAIVLDCHSFPSTPLPYEFDQDPDRPDFCIGTDDYHTPRSLVARQSDPGLSPRSDFFAGNYGFFIWNAVFIITDWRLSQLTAQCA